MTHNKQKTSNQDVTFYSKLIRISYEYIGLTMRCTDHAPESENLRGSGFPRLPLPGAARRGRRLQRPSIMGYYEIVDALLAVSADKHFTLSAAEVRNCLSCTNLTLNDPSDHYCTPVNSISVHDLTLPPGSCAEAVYFGSRFIPGLCPQVTKLNRMIFTHVQQNQWAYSAPNPACLLRVFCPAWWGGSAHQCGSWLYDCMMY